MSDVAAAGAEAWIKARCTAMDMHFQGKSVGVGGANYKEDWKVFSIEYKGGPVKRGGAAVAGAHSVLMLADQRVAPRFEGACECCVLM